jgi:hypothetical protein
VRWWNRPRTLAAQLLAEDELTDAQIGERVHKSRAWLTKIKRYPHVQERIAEIRQQMADAIVQAGIAVKVNRIKDAQADYDRLGAVIEARAQDTRYDEPGYATGLMAHKLKQIGAGKSATLVDEFEVDTALVAERRVLRRSVAEELAQIQRPSEFHGPMRELIIREYAGWPEQME